MSEQVIYRLNRRCQPCHNDRHDLCERIHYASPNAPRVECECQDCHDSRPRLPVVLGAYYAPCGCAIPLSVSWSPRVIPCDDPRSIYYSRGNRKAAIYAA